MRNSRHPNHRPIESLPPELRRTTFPSSVRDWILRQTGSPVVGVRRLPGASSVAVHVVFLSDGQSFVSRRYVWPGFLEDEPIAPQREVEALTFAVKAGVPAPEVVAADVIDDIPILLMTRLRGHAVAVPDLGHLAEVAATIHEVDATDFGHEYFPWCRETTVGPPATAVRPALWERALEVWHNEMPAFGSGLTHRDFHPGNVLWLRGRATGVVDWANACRGPWGCDIAHCRGNLIDLADFDVADRFLTAYESLTGRTYNPFWEIASELEHNPSGVPAVWVATAERRIGTALALLG